MQAKTEQKETTPGAAAIPGATGPAPTDAGKKAKKLNKGYAGDPEGLGDVDCDNEGVENDGCGGINDFETLKLVRFALFLIKNFLCR